MSILHKLVSILLASSFLSFSASAFGSGDESLTSTGFHFVKATAISLSPHLFTGSAIGEDDLKKIGCRYETSSDEKLEQLEKIISANISPDSTNTAAPTNLRTAIYLHTADGLTHRYLFNAGISKGEINGSLLIGSRTTQIISDENLINDLRDWAGPDTPWQKFSNTCF